MNKGVSVLCGLPAFYLPEGLMGIFDVLERRDTKPSIFGNYHYIKGQFTSKDTVVFVHTGGLPAVFAYHQELAG